MIVQAEGIDQNRRAGRTGGWLEMVKILFVCHGNICRSPMAEYVMKKLVKDAGREDEFEIASAAVSTEELETLTQEFTTKIHTNN